ncbi:hypothetical protein LOD99_11325 [Oopsacas minuta]|uniref:Helitron helicase-like domain-containing protein n=1 Tax=Oopsacas minuta TaxID=111878 RepID=A0AAV7K4B8_9METZ|nr:hypothetical protein LOD99_11325 [Oopsacas minuta]
MISGVKLNTEPNTPNSLTEEDQIIQMEIDVDIQVAVISPENFLEHMLAHDVAFKFLKTIRSSPAFWQQKQKEFMSMIRQLRCPTLYLTLSVADTKWPKLLIILKEILDNERLSTDIVQDLQWSELAELIK